MKLHFALTVFVASFCILSAAEEPKKISIENPGPGYVFVGRLNEPLGTPMKLEGVIVEGPSKGFHGGPNLRVQKSTDAPRRRTFR